MSRTNVVFTSSNSQLQMGTSISSRNKDVTFRKRKKQYKFSMHKSQGEVGTGEKRKL
jgi:hypothetical protein